MKHCLIVDDSTSIQKVAIRILQDVDVQGFAAESGEEALEICGRRMPDIIVVDWEIPGDNSNHTIAQLRRLPGGADAAILYCVSEADEDRISRALDSGANGHLMKPFDQETLLAAFERAGVL